MTAKRCDCGRARGGEYTSDQCRLCWLAVNDRAYQRLWGLPETAPEVRPVSRATARFSQPLPCVYRGEAAGETRLCPTCTGTVQVPLLQCAVKGTCTASLLLPGVQCCRICTERVEPVKAQESHQ